MSKRKTKQSATITLFLILTIAGSTLLVMPISSAHTPPWSIPTYAYLVASPDPVGLGQTAFVVMWIDKVPPTAGGVGGDRWKGFTVKITKPDGTFETKGPYTSDATSAAWFLYTPTQTGLYQVNFTFPGQVASLFHPVSGIPGSASDFVNDTYLASSATTTITVQQEAVQAPPTYPLPSTYWTRPIEGQNTQWSSIASNWLGGANIIDKVQPNGIAPNSPHIMWTKPLQDGGVVGGNYWSISSVAYYTGLSYEGKLNNPIIMYGRLYYRAPLGDGATNGPFVCVDLATGKTLWENSSINPSFGMLYLYESFNQHGVIGDGYLVQTSGTTWIMYDARTGAWLFNMTGVPSGFGGGFFGGYGTGYVGSNGEIVNYQFSNSGHWLAMWNSSAAPNTPLVLTMGNTTNAFQYRPIGKNANMSTAYTWNATLADLPAGSTILRAIPDDLILFYTSPTPPGMFFGWGTIPYSVSAVSLKPNSRGVLLWTKNYTPPEGNMTRSFGPVDPVARVFTLTDKETMQWIGFDLDSGEQLWGPVGNFRDFQYYGQVSNPPAPGHIYNQKLYVAGYGGELVCFDSRTGNIEWVYNNTYSGDQTPWGLYPLFITGIADGKVYCYSSEHSPNVPLYKGSRVRAIDADTGEEIWTLLSWYAIGSFGQSPAPIADGNIAYLNMYDMQIYCIGKGPSATTVQAPLTAVPRGSSLLITGTVTDQSPGAKKLVEDGKFDVISAMSDEVQGPWMEYLYMQKPIPENATGVQVKLTAFDSSGTSYDVGTAATDTNGKYGIAWTPPAEGTFHIMAEFLGTNSYYNSDDTTYVVVGPPAPTPAPVTPTPPPTTPPVTATPTPTPVSPSPPPTPPSGPAGNETIIIAAAAIIIIVAVAAAAVLLRRRK